MPVDHKENAKKAGKIIAAVGLGVAAATTSVVCAPVGLPVVAVAAGAVISGGSVTGLAGKAITEIENMNKSP